MCRGPEVKTQIPDVLALKMKSKLPLAFIMGILGTSRLDELGPLIDLPLPKPAKYPFTAEELEKLDQLEGKMKRRYLKELKAKYK